MSRFLRLALPPIKLPTIDQKTAEPKSIAGPILLQEGFTVTASEITGKYVRSEKNQTRVPELRRRIAANFLLGILTPSVKNPRFTKSPQTYFFMAISLCLVALLGFLDHSAHCFSVLLEFSLSHLAFRQRLHRGPKRKNCCKQNDAQGIGENTYVYSGIIKQSTSCFYTYIQNQ